MPFFIHFHLFLKFKCINRVLSYARKLDQEKTLATFLTSPFIVERANL